jgi:hypothetical protein
MAITVRDPRTRTPLMAIIHTDRKPIIQRARQQG